jgi:ubiquitin-protein ligase
VLSHEIPSIPRHSPFLQHHNPQQQAIVNPRMRRLSADAQMLRTEFAGHPQISVTPLRPEPSDIYQVTYDLRGVSLTPAGETIYTDLHTVVIQLSASYPRDKPIVTAESPVFHPNFGVNAGDEVCIGDYWSPAQGLADIVVTVGEMIQFQRYNVRSPLNPVAARWAAANESAFPVGNINLFLAEPEIVLGSAGPDRSQAILQIGSTENDADEEAAGSADSNAEGSGYDGANDASDDAANYDPLISLGVEVANTASNGRIAVPVPEVSVAESNPDVGLTFEGGEAAS